MVSLFKIFGRSGCLGAILLTFLTSCSSQLDVNPVDQQQRAASPQAVKPESGFLNSLPAPYANWGEPLVGGACGFDPIAASNQAKTPISGWALIDAKAGAVPEKIILRLDQPGAAKYTVLQPSSRPDVVKFFKNQALLKTGFYVEIPSPVLKTTTSVTALQAFQGKLYMCANKPKIKA